MLGPHSGSGRWHRLFADTLAGFPELRLLFLNLNNRIWTPGFHHLFSCFSHSTAYPIFLHTEMFPLFLIALITYIRIFDLQKP